jgi:dimethylaniline monooxygenase (N-oxide forming)
MDIAVIGAGPAGLTSAKQAMAAGHSVSVFEAHQQLGGIWNPAGGGAYDGVHMQSSRMSFPFSDFPSTGMADFPCLTEVHDYLRRYANAFEVTPRIRFGARVQHLTKQNGRWQLHAETAGGPLRTAHDAVMVASGELWNCRMPGSVPPAGGPRVFSAKDYRQPQAFAGQRVLVVGGGVSGADISSELVGHADSIDWAIRRKALFLPREFEGVYNDALFSYVGRLAIEEMSYAQYLDLLTHIMPGYMRLYRRTGLLPTTGFHNAVHINEQIVPHVAEGHVKAKPAFRCFAPDGGVCFEGNIIEHYDAVIFCLGYDMPDYGFIEKFDRRDLYQHFIYRHDPTLLVVNTPVDTEAFGTACPYFEAIAGWLIKSLSGAIELPSAADMGQWCRTHMQRLEDRRFYDCWLETIRLRLESGDLPDPRIHFDAYWTVVSSAVNPSNLCHAPKRHAARYDELFDTGLLKARLLASLDTGTRASLLRTGQILQSDFLLAENLPPSQAISTHLPYRMRGAGSSESEEIRGACHVD